MTLSSAARSFGSEMQCQTTKFPPFKFIEVIGNLVKTTPISLQNSFNMSLIRVGFSNFLGMKLTPNRNILPELALVS